MNVLIKHSTSTIAHDVMTGIFQCSNISVPVIINKFPSAQYRLVRKEASVNCEEVRTYNRDICPEIAFEVRIENRYVCGSLQKFSTSIMHFTMYVYGFVQATIT